MKPLALDCTHCGACCFNPPENVREGYVDYVEVLASDLLARRPELLRRHAVEKGGRVHLRLLADQRCSALSGALGRRVRCKIYNVRPAPCRRVQAGSDLCLRYRRGLGLGVEPAPAVGSPAARTGQDRPRSSKTSDR
jgi:Fe-S-cluster containining protein